MKILIGDLETTDFLTNGGKIVEAGLVSLDLNTGVKEILFDKVFNPGLTRDELAKKMDLSKWVYDPGGNFGW